MKRFCVLFAMIIMTAATCVAREVKNINAGWEFRLGDDGTAGEGWLSVGLPHSFSLPYFMSKDFYVGYGWYRNNVRLTKKDVAQYVALEFDGVFQEAEVFVNGKKAGTHVGGYTGFEIDITPYAKAGDNEIKVRVNNLWKATVAPRGGEHTFSGGIYRNVRLVKKDKAHIAWYGTRITTPTLEANEGKSSTVEAEIELEGLAQARPYTIEITISRNGETISRRSAPVSPQPPCNGHQSVVTIESPAIPNPALWSPSTPHLYTLTARLYDGKKAIDETTETFGFRWFTWTKDRGFFINGKHHFFRGANVHQDQAGWGDGVTDEASRRDVRMMKECGFDMIRGSHYPHSPAFSDECDRQGMLLWQEAPFWGTGGEKKDGSWTAGAYPGNKQHEADFEKSALQQLEEMIRIHRNHPSIFVWSMSNEPFFTGWGTMEGVKRMLKLMVDKAHQLDPTRKAAVGGAQRPLGNDRIDLIGDVAGYNGDGANIADFQQPDVPSVVSEYGSTTAVRPGKYVPGWGDLARNEGYKGRPWRSGQAIWCGFDHGSIFGDALGRMGIVDYFRLPKRSWYWYRNEYAHVAPPEWPTEGTPAALQLEAIMPNGDKASTIKTDGTEDVQLIVTVVDADGKPLSNTPDVTLSIVSGPGELPTGRSITFSRESDIQILDGKAAIAMRAYQQGKAVVEASSKGLKPARLELTFTGGEKYRPTMAIADRPYKRYAAEADANIQSFGKDNPTFATSSAEGHSAGMAADGRKDTYWTGEALTLDTERSISLREVILTTDCGANDFRIEMSNDNECFSGCMNNTEKTSDGYRIILSIPTTCRYIRVTFNKPGLKLYEIEAKGILK